MLLKSLVLVPFLANHAWASCNGDNLLNAFVKSSSQAAAFCSTYTPGGALPTFVPTTYAVSRYSSACSCIATVAPATTTTTSSKPIPTTSTSTKPPSTSTSCVCPVCESFPLTVTVTATATATALSSLACTTTQSAVTITSTVTITQTSSTSLEVDFTTTQPASTITITASCPSSSSSSTTSSSTTSTAPTCPSPSFSCSGACKDLTSDPNNCGACGLTCNVPNGVATCVNSQCVIRSCNNGFGDCDGISSNGCETNTLFDPNNCNTCHNVCVFPNGMGVCSGGTCQLGGCASGHQNCNGNSADGCETNTFQDPSNCGTCFHQCSSNGGTPFCNAGNCGINCSASFRDCNGNPNDGCETNIFTDKNNCGSCGHVCPNGLHQASCVSGVCQN